MARLPERLFEVLSGVDLILHAGDVDGATTLDALRRIAPVEGVRGDHDRDGSLPRVREHPTADVIVFGHTHRALVDHSGGVLVFNPGGVHQWTPETTAARLRQDPGWFEWSWLQVARHIRSYTAPTAGILEISEGRVEPRIVPL